MISDLANSFATSVGIERVNFIQGIKNYFEDLVREYEYYVKGEDKLSSTDSGKFRYVLAKNFGMIEDTIESDANTIFVIFTIEGLHVLHNDIDRPNVDTAIANIRSIKQWPHVPFFVTFSIISIITFVGMQKVCLTSSDAKQIKRKT